MSYSKIRESNDSDQALLTIQHRQPSYLESAHIFCRGLGQFVFEDVFNPWGHYFADRAFAHWFSFGHSSDGDVSVRADTHQTAVLPNRKSSTVVVHHNRGRLMNRVFRGDKSHALAHGFTNLHRYSPVCRGLLAATRWRRNPGTPLLRQRASCQWNQ